MEIQYIATKNKVVENLKVWFKSAEIQLVPYSNDRVLGEYLLLIEPYQIGTHNFAVSNVWKRWLAEKAPDTRLIFAGFASSTHSNFLNLANLPINLKDWLDKAKPVAAYPIKYAGVEKIGDFECDVFIDTWERNLPLTGRDMKKQMRKFIEGHDTANSFTNQINRIRTNLVHFRYLKTSTIPEGKEEEINDDILKISKSVKEEMSRLNIRWDYYRPFFEAMPFHDAFKEIESSMKALKNDVDQVNKGNVAELTHIEKLRDIIKQEMKGYINNEQIF